jgi:hypothetical protein
MSLPEKELQKLMERSIKLAFPDAMVYVTHPDQYEGAGKPDLQCCIHGCWVGLELKVQPNRPSDAQMAHLRFEAKAGGLSGVVSRWGDGVVRFKMFTPAEDGFTYKQALRHQWIALPEVVIGKWTYLNLNAIKALIEIKLAEGIAKMQEVAGG